ncbi:MULTISPECIES: lasso peptide [Moorena]|uniref:Lasso peptide n=1 Tax=Moorena producens 3L TaxID=489825 RepID=F4XY63_9CYAN|nr:MULTISPECIES: lasso peptide [Moorena]EGJ30460.1 hypothetical protein LYNGBM3L_50200 [Moorena producens 3L]NEP31295.1 lasso peptide [Moorena sp. SIO3B2]NEP65882.1 lasso peptide [Moorena sp. SIO3A5]NEQ09381.1 lasso peptide [Moorena sp. SIO4E2]NER87370.1 lasso peptide [Moorena sp. SIO3A2]
MTKTYTQPDLIIHGNVEEITLSQGVTADQDFIILTSGTITTNSTGSSDFTQP